MVTFVYSDITHLFLTDIESLDIDADDSETVGGAGDTGHDITVPQETYRALCQRLAAAESNSRIMEEKYSLLLQDLETMRYGLILLIRSFIL